MKMIGVVLFQAQFSWQALSLQTYSALPWMCDIPPEDQKAFSYVGRPWQSFVGRWAAIHEELHTWVPRHTRNYFRVIDIGSNNGFFSVQTAGVFPQALVVGVEGSVGVGNGNLSGSGTVDISTLSESPAVQNHLKWIQKLDLRNSVIATEVWDFNRVKELAQKRFSVDVMYLLSVFHWIDKCSREAGQYSHTTFNTGDTVNLMAGILSLARLHFIELPDFKQQDFFPQLRETFKGSEESFLKAAIQRSGRPKSVKEIYVDHFQGVRRLFVIKDEDEFSAPGAADPQTLFKHVLPQRLKSLAAHPVPACA